MTVGAIILAHERLDRAGALARHLSAEGVRVVIHVDRRVAPIGLEGVEVIQTRASDWGRFGLVEAALDAAAVLLRGGGLSHVCLLSGSCLPIRPVADLMAHLAAHPGRDFIESVALRDDPWVQEGLSEERFTLYHPFSFRTQRWLFDRSVDLQRRLGIRRRLPGGLSPRLGAQWWCLSAATLGALLADPRLPAWRRFFRKTWIPDEGFFQTIVPALAEAAPLPPLHVARFDPRGQPYVFHDDHAPLLAGADGFFARKIDPDAEGLYRAFLGGSPPGSAGSLGRAIADARADEVEEGRGLLSAGRYPGGTTQTAVETAHPYLVLVAGEDGLLRDLHRALGETPGLRLHGPLFQAGPVPFANGATLIEGCLSDGALIRDYRPAQFLQRLVHAEGAYRTGFLYRPGPPRAEAGQIVGDGNARIVFVGDGAGLLGLMRRPMATKRRWRLRRRVPKPRELWAWTRTIDASDAAKAQGPALREIRAILQSDWTDPAGWTVPEGAKMPPRPAGALGKAAE